jgi:hypothetical protein
MIAAKLLYFIPARLLKFEDIQSELVEQQDHDNHYGALGFAVDACANDCRSSASTLLSLTQKATAVYRGIRPTKLSYIFS